MRDEHYRDPMGVVHIRYAYDKTERHVAWCETAVYDGELHVKGRWPSALLKLTDDTPTCLECIDKESRWTKTS